MDMSKRSLKRQRAFTLIELLIVCFIIGILSAIAVPGYRRSVQRARVAEAQTLLRAIYDSCERLAWENQKENCAKAVEAGIVNFRKLDTLAKGTFQNNALQFRTDNFLYTLSQTSDTVTAEAIKGDYTGAKIAFNGKDFGCTNGTTTSAAQACQVWGAATWNQ